MLDRQSLADVLFAAMIIVALWAWAASAHTAIIAATVAYLGIATIRTVGTSETVRDVLQSRQVHVTERYRIERNLPSSLPQLVDSLQPPYTPPALPGSTFVAPVDMSVAKDAVLWALTLYGPDGKADPRKVNLKGGTEPPGRLKVAAPGKAAKEFLIARRLLQPVANGYRLNFARYGHVDDVKGLLPG